MSRQESNETAKRNYESAMAGEEQTVKGVHYGQRPYLWRENNPVHPYADTPCENFVPTPTINAGEDELSASKWKKILKYVLLGLFVGFMIYALVAQILETPEIFGLR